MKRACALLAALLSQGRSEWSWKRHAWAGPARSGIYKDSTEPLPEQWMWHAVADAVLANSLLRSLPEVDPAKVGIMGISWGGVITSTVIGIDSRFAFAIPTYGCGHLLKRGDTWLASAPLPTDATAWFVNVCSGTLTLSSDYQERTK